MVMRLRPIGLSCTGFVLTFLDACSGQAEDVRPERTWVDLGSDGLGLVLLWFVVLHQLSFVTKFRALDSGLCGLFFLRLCFQDVSSLMRCS